MAITSRDGKTQTALAEINMIPFIDVMLVLLIIFMITAPVIQSGLDVDVPTTETVKEVSESLLVVTIDRSENLYLQDAPVTINDLVSKIKEKLPTLKDQKVYFRADKKVSWETLVAVLDKLTDEGLNKIVVVTKPFEGKP
jgi:biopolymer transport protein ExbD/biopolymer transport protein TolR